MEHENSKSCLLDLVRAVIQAQASWFQTMNMIGIDNKKVH